MVERQFLPVVAEVAADRAAAAPHPRPRGRQRRRRDRDARRRGVRGRAGGRLPRARRHRTVVGGPVPALHRRHHRHAQGRDVVARGHLLRGDGRQRPRTAADAVTGPDRSTGSTLRRPGG